ncbi:DUF4229 domain-containing protein [Nocardioides sp. TRM66260-LWL]|uniref:DUF4229 domain-containing protein n=1 Tax=Nocardioides sp. TRM66260-LWL TaxID=2874478 RepID=UPI001CC72DBD|nr:DUF4229 domain-containing protein [Nocardioides sp. TRM66260-LWL]MBZ5734806.1 DUF4229 domain-containing protein [Nocardioides sp. TRM66260-LWL]
MKEFLVYTALRIVMFAATLGIVLGVWQLIAGEVVLFWAVLAAFVLSGIGSYYLLNTPRERFAQRVDERARRAAARFEELKAKEDAGEA